MPLYASSIMESSPIDDAAHRFDGPAGTVDIALRAPLEKTVVDLTVTAKNLTLGTTIEEYAHKRLSRLDRRLRYSVPLRLELRQEGTRKTDDRFVAEITATLKGAVLRGEERGASVQAAIDSASTVVERQIRRYKTRHYRRTRTRKATQFEETLADQFVELSGEKPDKELPDGRVVRTKEHTVSPMTVDEAAAQMELLGHTFFVFLNKESRDINVVYRRHDDDYGLIVPEQEGGGA